MKMAQRDMILWVLLCGGVGILWGIRLEIAAWNGGTGDFRIVYSASRCFLDHRDPYRFDNLRSEYLAEGGKLPVDATLLRMYEESMFTCLYPPTALFLILPLAALPWYAAHSIWIPLIVCLSLLTAYLIFRESVRYATGPPLILIGLLLIDLGDAIFSGNLAAVVIGLSVLSAWLMLNGKHQVVALICLALAVLMKPHDAGFVWLYFLVAPGAGRKYAALAFALAVPLAVPGVIVASSIAPGWAQELSANLHADSAKGGVSDPGPLSPNFGAAHAPINLQVALSIYKDDPRFYNSFSYAICGVLLMFLLIKTARTKFTQESAWVALASLAALTMLPVYHRGYDAKLLLLTIPACALLWHNGRWKWLALILNVIAVAATTVWPFALLSLALANTAPLLLRQLAPLSLLALGIFYLLIYWQGPEKPLKMGEAVQI